MRTDGAVVAGVDGCRTGWVVVEVPRQGRGRAAVRVVSEFAELVADVESGRLAAVAVDIPIGLPARGPRAADVLARRRLGPRRSSVFPAPARAVLGALDYVDACARSRRACGKALSVQLFNILPKVAETDRAMRPALQQHITEMCPELSFAVMTGAPLAQAKSTSLGLGARLDALARAFPDVAEHAQRPPPGARSHDVLDAFAGAWTARRYATGTHLGLGGDVDDTGLRMEVVA